MGKKKNPAAGSRVGLQCPIEKVSVPGPKKGIRGDGTRAQLPGSRPHALVAPGDIRRVCIYFNSILSSFQVNNLLDQDVYADNGSPCGSARAPRKTHIVGVLMVESGELQPDLEELQVTRGGSSLPALDPADICSAYSCQYFFQPCAPLTFGSAKV